MKYWLMKTEPAGFSWDDLQAAPHMTTTWDGIRNYQARNYLREMRRGDQVFFYHSQVKPPRIMGIAEVVRTAYPDSSQFDPASDYYDPRSQRENPRWEMVEIRFLRSFEQPITLPELRKTPGLGEMVLLQKGSRLSVQPVSAKEWRIITALRKPA